MAAIQGQPQPCVSPFSSVCLSCGVFKPSADFFDSTTASFSNFCIACRMNFIKEASLKNEKQDGEVPEHLLSRAFKIKHYFVGLKVVPQARWISVSDNFRCAEKNCCTAKSVTHRTLLRDSYQP